jgi:hypothetical protein
MLDNQPELQIVDVYVALAKDTKGVRVGYGSLAFGVGERKILSKSFTIFRSAKDGSLYVSYPSYETVVDGKKAYKENDIWIDVEEAKYWKARILDEANRQLGVAKTTTTTTTTAKTTVEATPPAEAAPATPGRRVGWKKS